MASVFEKAKQEPQQPPEMEEAQDSGFGEEGGEGDDGGQSPEYMKARELMLSKLYEEGAAEGIGQAMANAPDPVQGIVDQSMALAEAMEQATQGSVPDEEVMSFVLDIVQEVVEIGQSTGTQISNRDIAEAVREVLAQVIENLGGDSQAIRQEMSQVDPEQVAMAAEQEG